MASVAVVGKLSKGRGGVQLTLTSAKKKSRAFTPYPKKCSAAGYSDDDGEDDDDGKLVRNCTIRQVNQSLFVPLRPLI